MKNKSKPALLIEHLIKLMIVISPSLLFIILFKWVYWQYYVISYNDKQASGFGIPDSKQNYGIYGFYFLLVLRIVGFLLKPKELPITKYFTLKTIGGILLYLLIFFLIAGNIMFVMHTLGSFYSRHTFEKGVTVHMFVIVIISFLIVKLIVDKIDMDIYFRSHVPE